MNRLLCIISDTKLFFFVDAPRPNKGLELQTIKGSYEVDISMYLNREQDFRDEVWKDLCESAGYMSSTYIAALYLYELESDNSRTMFRILNKLVESHNVVVNSDGMNESIQWTNKSLNELFLNSKNLNLDKWNFSQNYVVVENTKYNIATTNGVEYHFIDMKLDSINLNTKETQMSAKVVFPKTSVRKNTYKKTRYKKNADKNIVKHSSSLEKLSLKDPRAEYLEEKTKNMNFEVSEPR
ncbi:MAG: hypothetical protein KH761_04535 [Veillonella sp.]|uniref:hypothetical protein n=1 Tax=Veillonella sp. TaxID=1926307 RepID=UPI00257BD2DF|nr:hypothetical protein [Veillonella sp.]MBS6126087.1 hypothetical protein [Veillonella sp.]